MQKINDCLVQDSNSRLLLFPTPPAWGTLVWEADRLTTTTTGPSDQVFKFGHEEDILVDTGSFLVRFRAKGGPDAPGQRSLPPNCKHIILVGSELFAQAYCIHVVKLC